MNQQLNDEQSDFARFVEAAEKRYEEANAANEARYQDILGRLEDSRVRNLERVANYGNAARDDLDERAAETLGNIQANLSQRGLGDSTIFDAFRQRNERDLAREQQRLSEMVDSRTADYDQRLTGDIASFMERRHDILPDYGSLRQLAMQYGLGNEGRGYNDSGSGSAEPTARYRSSIQGSGSDEFIPDEAVNNRPNPLAGFRRPMSAGAYARRQNFMDGQLSGLVPYAQNQFGQPITYAQNAWESNRHPEVRKSDGEKPEVNADDAFFESLKGKPIVPSTMKGDITPTTVEVDTTGMTLPPNIAAIQNVQTRMRQSPYPDAPAARYQPSPQAWDSVKPKPNLGFSPYPGAEPPKYQTGDLEAWNRGGVPTFVRDLAVPRKHNSPSDYYSLISGLH